jgi:hypothetical protein
MGNMTLQCGQPGQAWPGRTSEPSQAAVATLLATLLVQSQNTNPDVPSSSVTCMMTDIHSIHSMHRGVTWRLRGWLRGSPEL